MSFEESLQSPKSPGACFQILIDLLPRQGFEIVRRRDIAWLVQARKNIQNRWLQLNILCRPGAQTQVIVSCQDFGDEQLEKIAVTQLCEAIRELTD